MVSFVFVRVAAASCEMRHETVASQHLGHGRHLSVAVAPELHRRSGLGPDETTEGRDLGTELAIHGKQHPAANAL